MGLMHAALVEPGLWWRVDKQVELRRLAAKHSCDPTSELVVDVAEAIPLIMRRKRFDRRKRDR